MDSHSQSRFANASMAPLGKDVVEAHLSESPQDMNFAEGSVNGNWGAYPALVVEMSLNYLLVV
jgi:hypothetical protein